MQSKIKGDEELQAWAEDITTFGSVTGMPKRIESAETLVDILATVLYIFSAEHCAVNFSQARSALWLHEASRSLLLFRVRHAPDDCDEILSGRPDHRGGAEAFALRVQESLGGFVPNMPLQARDSYLELAKRGGKEAIKEQELARCGPVPLLLCGSKRPYGRAARGCPHFSVRDKSSRLPFASRGMSTSSPNRRGARASCSALASELRRSRMQVHAVALQGTQAGGDDDDPLRVPLRQARLLRRCLPVGAVRCTCCTAPCQLWRG